MKKDLERKKIKLNKNRIKNLSEEYEAVIFWVILSFFMVVFLDKMGTLFSGYHLVDDQNYININKGLMVNGLKEQLLRSVRGDFHLRFRPLWSFTRVLDTYFFMDSYGILSLKNVVVITTSSSLFFYYARRRGVSRAYASLFGFFTFLGNQAAVLWRLGPQEPVGLLLFSIALVATDLLIKKKSFIRSSFFVLILILLTLQKEAFLACMPGFYLLLFSSFLKERKEEKVSFFSLCGKFILKYKIEILLCTVVLAAEAYFITTKVGLNSIEYAGFSVEDGLFYYLEGILRIMQGPFLPYLLFLFTFFLFFQQIWKKEDFHVGNLIEILFPVYIILIQLVIHAKSGMWERYLIPAVIGVAYIAIILGHKYFHKNKRLYFVYLQLLLIFLLNRGWNLPAQAKDFTLQAENFQELVSDVLTNISTDDNILLCSDPENQEIDYSFSLYLDYYHGYGNFSYLSEYENEIEAIKEADLLFGLPGTVQTKIALEGVNKEDYRVHQTTHYEIGVKEGTN